MNSEKMQLRLEGGFSVALPQILNKKLKMMVIKALVALFFENNIDHSTLSFERIELSENTFY